MSYEILGNLHGFARLVRSFRERAKRLGIRRTYSRCNSVIIMKADDRLCNKAMRKKRLPKQKKVR